MKITNLINFIILDNHIKSKYGKFYFYKIEPPNLSILTDREILTHTNSLNLVLKSLPLNIDFQMFSIDRCENLSANIEYINSISDDFKTIKQGILSDLNKNKTDTGVQKGFYFIINPKKEEDKNLFEMSLKSASFVWTLEQKQELINIMRYFLLRDFKDFPLYVFNEDEGIKYDKLKSKKNQTKEEFILTNLTKALLPTNLNFRKGFIEQSGFLRQVAYIKNFPLSFENLALLKPISVMRDVTLNIRVSEMNKATAIHLANKQLNSTNSTSLNENGIKQLDAINESIAITDFYRKYSADNDKMFYVNVFIEIYAPNQENLNSKITHIESVLDKCKIDILNWEQEEGFNGICPILTDKMKFLANNIPSASLSAMYPFSHSSRNDARGVYLGKTNDGGYMFLDFFKRTHSVPNGNVCILGGSGFGKSHTMKKIISQNIMRGVSSFIFDHEGEYIDLVNKMGGTNIDCTLSKNIINPLEIRKFTLDENDENEYNIETFNVANDFLNHLSWLRDFLRYIVPHASGKELDLLMVIIREMYNFKNINEETDFSKLKASDYPIFSDLKTFMLKVLANKEDFAVLKLFQSSHISECLLLIEDIANGSLSPLFNGYTNLPNGNVINFNIQDLANGDQNRSQAYMFNIFTFIGSKMFARLGDLAIYVDELALFCNKQNLRVLQYLKTYSQRIRKYSGILSCATQQLSDIMIDDFKPYTSALYNLASIKIIFNTGDIDIKMFKDFARFSDERIDDLAKFGKGECFIFVGTHDKYRVQIDKLDFEGELFGKAGG